MNNNTERIGKYLQNEMSVEERNEFEKQLAYDKELQQELAIQKQIVTAINTAGLKSSFGKAIRTKFISRMFIRWGIVAIIVSGLVFFALMTNIFSRFTHDREISIVNGIENFVINNSVDTIIETEEGVVFGIPANAFGTENKKIRLEIKTAINPKKIMLQGLSTTSNGQLLQTAGMFYINGYDGEKQVPLTKKIDVSVPTKNVNPAMQLFNGVQDSSGRINWVDPKPIEKSLRTYDITTLDFYPTRYIPTVKALGKNYTNKKYTDSLYYSFSGYQNDYPKDFESHDAKIFFQKCASCHVMGKDATGPNLQGVLSRWPNKQILKEWILNWQNATKKYPYVANKASWGPSVMQVFEGQLNDAELEALIKWVDEWKPQQSPTNSNLEFIDTTSKLSEIQKDSVKYEHYEIDPSRIKAIWDRKFNNTILATKEFEERLRFLHELCTADYFRAYLEGMNKPMYEIDQLCADNSSGKVREKFLEFAARKDGGVMLKEGMQEKLSAYFEKKFKAYREASEKTWAKRNNELARLAAIADDKRREQETRDYIRQDKNFTQEFCINLTEAYKQIGIKSICEETVNDTIPSILPAPPTIYYNVTIDTVGWKNLDMYVLDATQNRESMTYTDPTTGKISTLTYKEVSISIENQQLYDKVFVYLLPDSLNSFQRIEESGNVFKEKLNMLFRYEVLAIGFKGDQTYFYKQTNLQPGQYGFRLSSVTEKELKQILKSNTKDKSDEIFNEYEFQLFEQQEMRREIQLRKEQDFRTQIMMAIWSCGERIFPEIDRATDTLNKTLQ